MAAILVGWQVIFYKQILKSLQQMPSKGIN
jgi:hypothetical protein